MATLRKGRKHRNWWPFMELKTFGQKFHRTEVVWRILPNGNLDPVFYNIPGHPAMSGNQAPPRRKRRSIPHKKGTRFPGMWSFTVGR